MELMCLLSRGPKMVHAYVCHTPARSTAYQRPIWSFHSKESKKLAYCGWNQILDSYGTCVSHDIHLYVLHLPS